MDRLVMLLAVLGMVCQVYVLARLPAPKMKDAAAVFRQKPEMVGLTIVTAVAALFIQSIVLLAEGDPWVALIFWAGGMLFTAMSAGCAFTGVRYGAEGFTARDELGRRRFVHWADVLSTEKTHTSGGRAGFRLEVMLVYAPGVTLAIIRTMEGREQGFLDLLNSKRPDLPAGRPEGAAKPQRLLGLAVAAVLGVFGLVLVLGGLEKLR